MKCYRCNSRLAEDRNVCPKCGADVRLYRKIIHASNQYYNLGLARAKARDLTGAAECLRVSLQLYKKNINARNLLGLVYYEMGEAAQALKEWVISKNFRHRGNLADTYIQELRENRQALDSADHSIHKYNQALEYVRNGSRDLALIQLKKVVSVNPRMLKAYMLLALLYMQDERYEEAGEMVDRCLKIDRGNPQALSYKRELRRYGTHSKKENVGVAGELEREEIIIPVRMRDWGSYFANAMYILFGFLLALGVLYYIIIPGKEAKFEENNLARIQEYENRYTELNAQIADLGDQLESLQSEKDSVEENLRSSSEASGELKSAYEQLLAVSELYVRGDFAALSEEFPKLDRNLVQDEAYQGFYDLLKADYDINIAARIFQLAINAREQQQDREQAIQLCDRVLELNPEYDAALFYKGLCQQELGNTREAVGSYITYMTRFPQGQWMEEIRKNMQAIAPDILSRYDRGTLGNELQQLLDLNQAQQQTGVNPEEVQGQEEIQPEAAEPEALQPEPVVLPLTP